MAAVLSLAGSSADDTLHGLTVVNSLRNNDMVSLYIWGSGSDNKGENLLEEHLPPDSEVTFSIPSGKCNILAFDELGNSYGIQGNIQKNTADTLEIDLEYITYGRPNVDLGPYMLILENSLHGFALDTLIISSPSLDEDFLIHRHRIFPGNKIIIWLNKGIYRFMAVDQTGTEYRTDKFLFSAGSEAISIDESMSEDTSPPVGIVGQGSASLIITNRIPYSAVTTLRIVPETGLETIYLADIVLYPGMSIIAELDPGFHVLTAFDEEGAVYRTSFELEEDGVRRLFLTYDLMDYDLSFPEDDGQP